jgi:hypothetical protein
VTDDTLGNLLVFAAVLSIFLFGFVVGTAFGYHNLAGAEDYSVVLAAAKAL